MGPGHDISRLPVGVHTPPSVDKSFSTNQSAKRPRQETGPAQRSLNSAAEGGHRAGQPRGDIIHVNVLPNHEEVGGMAPDPQPKASQRFHQAKELPHGNPSCSLTGATHRMVGRYARSKGRVPTRSSEAFRQEVARFLHRRSDLQIQGAPLRLVDSTQDLHTGGQSRGGVPTTERNFCLRLSGRLADNGSVARDPESADPDRQPTGHLPRADHQHREVRPGAVATDPVPGSQASLRRRKGGPNRGESDSDHRMCRRTVVSRNCSSQTVDEAPRPHGEPDSHPTPVQTPHESHPAPRALQVQPSQEPAVHSDPQLPEDKEGAPMVDSATQPEARTAFFAPNTMFMPYYGCFQGGMGSALGGYYVIGQMDPGYRQAPHQQAGTPGYPSGSAETTPASQGSNSQGTLRQPISGDVHKPTGGNPQQIAVSPSSQAAHLVPAPRDTAPSGTSPRGGQQDSRCSIQGGNRPSDTEKGQRDLGGMAAEQSVVPDPIQSAGEAVHRPVCDEGKQPATSVLHVGPGPHGLRSGCHDHQLGQDAGLRISPHRSNTQGPGETLEIQELQDASSSSAMAQADVVPEAAVSHGSRADQPASDGGAHPTSGQDTDSTNDDSDPAPDCVDHFVRAYTADGLSEEAANLAAKARRPSTRATYNSRLKQYFSWCRGHQVSPHKAPVGAVAEFLTEQFKRKNAKPRSIRCFRTAIASIHHGFEGGLTVSSSPTLSSLIKGTFHERPPDRSLVPAWDLSLALGVVADSPYEPMHLLDLPELTRKTVFLVAAASGRRVSEIHALSTKEGHLRFSNGAVSLLPRAGFLAKNQTLDFTPKPIVLPDLRKASGSPDCGPWCPVRALKYYLQKTERLRLRPDGTTEDRLFLITVSPFTPAKKSTMARWIIQVIKESLSRQESQLAGSHVRAHDLRAQMASWALYKGASIQEVMDAAGWSSSTTFQSVYLRDPLCAQATTSARVLSAATSGSLRKQRD